MFTWGANNPLSAAACINQAWSGGREEVLAPARSEKVLVKSTTDAFVCCRLGMICHADISKFDFLNFKKYIFGVDSLSPHLKMLKKFKTGEMGQK